MNERASAAGNFAALAYLIILSGMAK